jgi:hypothetical protein
MIWRSIQRQLILTILLCATLAASRTSSRHPLSAPIQHHHFPKSRSAGRYRAGPSLHTKNLKHFPENHQQISRIHHVHTRGLSQAYSERRGATADLNLLAGSGGVGSDHLEASLSAALRSSQRAPQRRSSLVPEHSRPAKSVRRSTFEGHRRTSGYRHGNRTHSAKPHRSGH